MTTADSLEQGRKSSQRQDWADAYYHLSRADEDAPLESEDLERLAVVAYLIGRDAESSDVWARAHHAYLDRGDVENAARCAFWLAFGLLQRRESARGAGWLARARRILDEDRHHCVEQGYLLLPVALKHIFAGENEAAYATFTKAAEFGDRFGDPDLIAFALHGRGRALIRMGDIRQGVTMLDEAMVAVEAGEVSPIVAGNVYCSVIEACQEIFDLARAQEWTAALTRWCASQPDLVPYRGQCLVRRAEILQVHGDWSDAMTEAERACERLARPPGEPAAGAAFYRQAELHRLRGNFSEAEAAYGQANRWGPKPRPGLALLRLAQGEVDAAEAAIRRVAHEAQDRASRSVVLPAFVEILLAAGDVMAARAAADELCEIAAELDAPLLRAVAAQADGAVLLAEGDARGALDALRRAWTDWEELEAPYDAARVRVLLGLACRELGDADTAEMEFDAARWIFEKLGAAPDLAWIDALSRRSAARESRGLTPRELEVLRLVAAGETNKSVADRLFISERTVERHVSNIFAKLDVSSRAAATAYAYENDLI